LFFSFFKRFHFCGSVPRKYISAYGLLYHPQAKKATFLLKILPELFLSVLIFFLQYGGKGSIIMSAMVQTIFYLLFMFESRHIKEKSV